MIFNTPLFIAWRYWRSKSADRFGRLVTHLASLGIILGVMALVIVLSVMNGLENMQKRNVLTALPHAIITPVTQNYPKKQPLTLPDFVQKAVPINNVKVIIQSQQGINAGQLIGVEQSSDDPLLKEVSQLEQLLPKGQYHLLVGAGLAQRLKINIGDKLRLIITENSQYTPFGRVPVQRLFTVSGIYYAANEASDFTLFANLTDVGRLLRIDNDNVQGVRLFLADPFNVTALPAFYPENVWKISDWRQQKGEFFQAVRMEKNMMGLLISLIILVAISNIITSLSLMVVDKQGEIAILQTQGLTKRQVMQIFIFQGAFVGVIGTIIGGGLGVAVTLYLGDILVWINPMGVMLPTQIEATQVLAIVVISMLFSLLCTLYPAYSAAKVEPAEALRYE